MSADEHKSLIETPKQLIMVVVLGFALPVIAAMLLAYLVVTGSKNVGADHPTLESDAVAKRIKPVAEVVLAEAGGAKAPRTGEEVYQATCTACHATGVANAPKFGDKAAWAPHIKLGQKRLLQNAISGIRAMPPRGGSADLPDLELERALVYMANAAGAKFRETVAPKEAASSSAGDAAVAAGSGDRHDRAHDLPPAKAGSAAR